MAASRPEKPDRELSPVVGAPGGRISSSPAQKLRQLPTRIVYPRAYPRVL